VVTKANCGQCENVKTIRERIDLYVKTKNKIQQTKNENIHNRHENFLSNYNYKEYILKYL